MDPRHEPLADELERWLPWIRSQFPQLEHLRGGERRLYLDNAAGTLLVATAAEAMADASLWANPQPERAWPAGPAARRLHARVREVIRGFIGAGEGDPVFFSESTTASLFKLREALEPSLSERDIVVVSDADHFANISPWEWRARHQVRRAPITEEGHLDVGRFRELLSPAVKLVALTVAGNGLGTLLRLETLIAEVRSRCPEALVVLDAVHAAPHVPVDVRRLDADALAFSTYKLFGPFAGVLWLRPTLFDQLQPYHVEPHTDPRSLLEWGTLNNVTVAGIEAALSYLSSLGERLEPHARGLFPDEPRAARRFRLALAAIQAYEARLSRFLCAALLEIDGVTLRGVADPERTDERVPTLAFTLDRLDPAEWEMRLWEKGQVQVAGGAHYSAAVTRGLGLTAVARASFAHYNDREDAARLIRAVRDAAAG